MRADARGNADAISCMRRISLLRGRALLMTSQKYVMYAQNIYYQRIVL